MAYRGHLIRCCKRFIAELANRTDPLQLILGSSVKGCIVIGHGGLGVEGARKSAQM
jgi:hypothetical protein